MVAAWVQAPSRPWLPHEDDILIASWNSGLSPAAIVSRLPTVPPRSDSVILARLRLLERRDPSSFVFTCLPKRTGADAIFTLARIRRLRLNTWSPPPAPPLPGFPPLSLVDLPVLACHYPVDAPTHSYCGAPADSTTRYYCEHHYRVMYVPSPRGSRPPRNLNPHPLMMSAVVVKGGANAFEQLD